MLSALSLPLPVTFSMVPHIKTSFNQNYQPFEDIFSIFPTEFNSTIEISHWTSNRSLLFYFSCCSEFLILCWQMHYPVLWLYYNPSLGMYSIQYGFWKYPKVCCGFQHITCLCKDFQYMKSHVSSCSFILTNQKISNLPLNLKSQGMIVIWK